MEKDVLWEQLKEKKRRKLGLSKVHLSNKAVCSVSVGIITYIYHKLAKYAKSGDADICP